MGRGWRIVSRVLWVLLVVSGFTALGLHFTDRISEVSDKVTAVQREMSGHDQERKGLADRLQKITELSELIGSELASKDEEFSSALSRAIGSEERQIAAVRSAISDLEDSLRRSAERGALEAEKSSVALREVQGSLANLRDQLSVARNELESLAGRVAESHESLESALAEIKKAEAPSEGETQLYEVLDQRVAEMADQTTRDINWVRGELQRISGRLDDLGHAVSRLETRPER